MVSDTGTRMCTSRTDSTRWDQKPVMHSPPPLPSVYDRFPDKCVR